MFLEIPLKEDKTSFKIVSLQSIYDISPASEISVTLKFTDLTTIEAFYSYTQIKSLLSTGSLISDPSGNPL